MSLIPKLTRKQSVKLRDLGIMCLVNLGLMIYLLCGGRGWSLPVIVAFYAGSCYLSWHAGRTWEER